MKGNSTWIALAALLLVAPASWAEAELEDEMTEAAVAAEEAASAPSEGSVPRGIFTLAVVDREPQGEVSRLTNDQQQILYFSEVLDLAGTTVTHRWQRDGETLAEVPFEVRGPRWRVFSSKTLDPGWLGEWTVSVVDDSGRVLRQDRFEYIGGSAAAASAAADTMAPGKPAAPGSPPAAPGSPPAAPEY
jgi:hypothetical protein